MQTSVNGGFLASQTQPEELRIGAGYFAFLPPCDPKLEAALPEV